MRDRRGRAVVASCVAASLLRTFAAWTLAAREARRHSTLWGAATGRPHAAARRAAVGIAVRTIVLELLAATAADALRSRPESIGTSARLADRELGNRASRRLLSFDLRQRGADQWAVDRSLFLVALAIRVG